MQDWNSTCYLRFEAELTRPVKELASRINFSQAAMITDLGCEAGNSTAVLCKEYPKATITGVDISPLMLEKARTILPGCQFKEVDIRDWQPEKKQDIIFSSASLQSVPDHETLFTHLITQLSPRGVFAVHLPDYWQENTHRLMRDIADEQGTEYHKNNTILSAENYYEILSQAGCLVDIWRTTYFHVFPSIQAIIDWLYSTGLRHFIHHLTNEQQNAYMHRYYEALKQHYKKQSDNNIIISFPHLFIVAQKTL